MSGRDSDNLFGESVREPKGRAKPKFGKRWHQVNLKNVIVTQADIDAAMPKNSHSCMIADAIKRQYPEFTNVSVDIATIRWTDVARNRRVLCLTPLVCQENLASFDYGVKPEPFMFSVRSTQVTERMRTEPVVDQGGKPVLERNATTGQLRHKRRIVSMPSRATEFVNSSPGMLPGRDSIVGGRLPPRNRASRMRKFGMRGFTWADGENPQDIKARQQAAYGWKSGQGASDES